MTAALAHRFARLLPLRLLLACVVGAVLVLPGQPPGPWHAGGPAPSARQAGATPELHGGDAALLVARHAARPDALGPDPALPVVGFGSARFASDAQGATVPPRALRLPADPRLRPAARAPPRTA